MRPIRACCLLAVLLAPASVWAQQPAPPQQPPAVQPYPPYGQATPGYGTPPVYGAPPGYGVPPAYGQPQGGYPPPAGGYVYPPPVYAYPQGQAQPPPTKAYREGDPVPAGYHLEEHPRKGLVTAGYIVVGIPWGMGLLVASAGNFANSSGWLAVPVAGPWITMGQRHSSCSNDSDRSAKAGLECVGDVFVVMTLIMDGIMQATGGILLTIGYTATKTTLVRDDQAFRVTPMQIGSGYGFGAVGAF